MLQTKHYCTEHHEHYISENRCPKCQANKRAIKPERCAVSALRSSEWLGRWLKYNLRQARQRSVIACGSGDVVKAKVAAGKLAVLVGLRKAFDKHLNGEPAKRPSEKITCRSESAGEKHNEETK